MGQKKQAKRSKIKPFIKVIFIFIFFRWFFFLSLFFVDWRSISLIPPPFLLTRRLQVVNFTHLMPTRYNFDLTLKVSHGARGFSQ